MKTVAVIAEVGIEIALRVEKRVAILKSKTVTIIKAENTVAPEVGIATTSRAWLVDAKKSFILISSVTMTLSIHTN